MKTRKQLGRPRKSRTSFPVAGTDDNTVPGDIIEMLMERAGRTIVQESQLAAKQRRLLDILAANVARNH